MEPNTVAGHKVMSCDADDRLVGVFRYLNVRAPKNIQWE